jgi:hypothetical protein
LLKQKSVEIILVFLSLLVQRECDIFVKVYDIRMFILLFILAPNVLRPLVIVRLLHAADGVEGGLVTGDVRDCLGPNLAHHIDRSLTLNVLHTA